MLGASLVQERPPLLPIRLVPSPAGTELQFGGDVVVGASSRLSTVPGAPFGVGCGVGHLGQDSMRLRRSAADREW